VEEVSTFLVCWDIPTIVPKIPFCAGEQLKGGGAWRPHGTGAKRSLHLISKKKKLILFPDTGGVKRRKRFPTFKEEFCYQATSKKPALIPTKGWGARNLGFPLFDPSHELVTEKGLRCDGNDGQDRSSIAICLTPRPEPHKVRGTPTKSPADQSNSAP